jgi:hypothetical protein
VVHVERGDGRLQLVVRELGAELVAEAGDLGGGEAAVLVLVEVVEGLAGLLVVVVGGGGGGGGFGMGVF